VAPKLYPLLGLEATLADEACERVELRSASGETVRLFVRQGEDAWVPDDPEREPIHGRELLAQIRAAFGETCDGMVCCVADEQVVYAIEGGSVRIRRGPRERGPRDAAPVDLAPVAEALGIPRSRRKAKLKQAVQFARIVEAALPGERKGALRVLDLACGRSYLGLVLVHLLAARGREVTLRGVDADPTLVEKCHEIASTLAWSNCAFEAADLAAYAAEPDSFDVAVSLHGCDTLTDEAIRIACEARVPLVFVAPCCQHELRHQWGEHPLRWVARYGLLEQRLADVLTDGFRCLVMEALGYQVKALRFTAPDVTPKNLLLQARLASGPRRARARDAVAFMRQFGVRPTLAPLLEQAGVQLPAP
jgi:hypothetical protein